MELKDIVELAIVERLNKKQLIQLITIRSQYLVFVSDDNPVNNATDIDLVNKKISLCELIPLYNFDEKIACIKLIKRDDKFYSQYEVGDEYPINYVDLDDIDLLCKNELNFDEFNKVFDFLSMCIVVYDDTDFIVNNKAVMRFNFA